jgi:ADP-ribose pyrophosphatase YjhB (NUDIX family)
MDRPRVIPTVYLVLMQEGKILLSRRCHTGFQDGKYSLPAGHPATNDEPLSHTMIREAKEEVGIEISLKDLELIHVMHRKQTEPSDERRINLFFTAKKWKGEPKIMEPDKCNDIRWFEMDNLPKSTISYVKQAIDCFRKNVRYSEYGFEQH